MNENQSARRPHPFSRGTVQHAAKFLVDRFVQLDERAVVDDLDDHTLLNPRLLLTRSPLGPDANAPSLG